MKTEKCIMVLLAAILVLSVAGIAEENAEKTKVVVIAKNLGIDKNLSKQMVFVNITTDKIGHLTYVERYYSKNETGKLIAKDARMYFNATIKNNTVFLRIKRPLSESGEPYTYVRAIVNIDNEKSLDSWLKYVDSKNASVNKGANGEKKAPGFEIIISVVTMVSMVLLLKRKKMGT